MHRNNHCHLQNDLPCIVYFPYTMHLYSRQCRQKARLVHYSQRCENEYYKEERARSRIECAGKCTDLGVSCGGFEWSNNSCRVQALGSHYTNFEDLLIPMENNAVYVKNIGKL